MKNLGVGSAASVVVSPFSVAVVLLSATAAPRWSCDVADAADNVEYTEDAEADDDEAAADAYYEDSDPATNSATALAAATTSLSGSGSSQ